MSGAAASTAQRLAALLERELAEFAAAHPRSRELHERSKR